MLRGFREYAETAPDEVNCMTVAISFPEDEHLPPPVHNQKCFVVASVYVGDPEEGMRVLQPLRELGTPLADISQPMPWRIVQAAFDAFFQRQEVRTYWKSTSATELPGRAHRPDRHERPDPPRSVGNPRRLADRRTGQPRRPRRFRVQRALGQVPVQR